MSDRELCPNPNDSQSHQRLSTTVERHIHQLRARVLELENKESEIICPACGEVVKQVASATLGLALWQHYGWTCRRSKLAALSAWADSIERAATGDIHSVRAALQLRPKS